MLKKKDVLLQFNEYMDDFFSTTQEARAEASSLYKIRDGHRVRQSSIYQDYKQFINDELENRSTIVVNLAAAYMRAAVGQQINSAKDVSCVSSDVRFDKDSDIANDCLEYVARIGMLDYSRTLAFEDAYTRGWGCTVLQNNTNVVPLSGEPYIGRKFFAAYDTSVRSGDLNRDASWCSYGDPVTSKNLNKYIDLMGGDVSVGATDVYSTQYMQYVSQNDLHLVDFLHHYYWRDYVNVYDVGNPYHDYREEFIRAAQTTPEIASLYKAMRKKTNMSEKSVNWTLDSEGIKEFDAFVENVKQKTGISFSATKSTKRQALFYYQAQIAKGQVLSCGASYTQGGHALNFITSHYDETLGYYYGMMRPLGQIQIALNEAMEAYHNYVKRAEIGGTIAINKNIDSKTGDFFEKLRRRFGILGMPDGATVTQLGLPDTIQGLRGLVDFYVSIISNVAGLPPEILGMLSTKDMGEGLMNAVTEQMNISLLHTTNGVNSYMRHHGRIAIDLMRKMAQVGDRQHLVALSGHGEENIIEFSEKNLSADYAFVLRDKPAREDVKRRDAKMLIDTMAMLQPAQQAAVLPVLLAKLPIDYQDKEELKKALAPPEPNPQIEQMAMQNQMLDLNIKQSTAEVQKSMAMEAQANAKAKVEQIEVDIAKKASEINKNNAATEKTNVDAAVAASGLIGGYVEAQYL